jgi:PAS domain S-box-containing protein
MQQKIRTNLEKQDYIYQKCCNQARFFNLSLDMLAIANLDGYFIHLNPAWQRILGFTAEELSSQPYLEFVHPEDREKTKVEMGKVAEGIPVTDFENRYRCKDGSYKYLAWTGFPFLEEGLVYAVARDVTKFKQTEAALREHQQLLQEIIDAAPMDIFLKDLQGKYLLINRSGENTVGLGREQVIGKTDYDLFPKEIADAFRVNDLAVLEVGKPLESEEVILQADEPHTVIAIKFPLYNSSGDLYAVCGITTDITRRKLAETALFESEERFRQLAENIDAVFWVHSLDEEKILYVSPAYEKIWGRSSQSLYENPFSWHKAIHPEDLPMIQAAMERNRRQGEFPETEYRIVQPNGSIRWIQDRIFPVRNSQGRVYRLAGIVQDITERKLAEIALTESEKRFRQLAENIDAVVWMWSVDDQQILYLSPAYEKIWGRSSQLLLENPQNWLDTIYPEDLPRMFSRRQQLIQGECLEETYRIIKPDGSVSWISDRAFPIYNSQGRIYRAAGISEDITERIMTEAALRENEQKYRHLIETSQGIIWSVNTEGILTFVNPAALKLYGYAAEEVMGRKFSDFISKELQEKGIEKFKQFLDSDSIIQYETDWFHKNGTQFYLSCNIIALRDDTGKIIGITGTAVDITERKKAEEQLKLSLQEKEALLKEVHHRVKNNLQVISSLLDLQSQQIQDPVTMEVFRASQNRVKSIALIHEKLYQSDNLARVNLAEYIQSLTSYLLQTYPIDPNNISLQLQVKQIFLNLDIVIPCGLIINELVSNALKYGFPGNTKGTIWVCLNSVCLASTEKQGQQFTLVIGNNGMKLQDEQQFYQPKSLGFQLVQALVKQLQGTIEITSSPGTEFKIKFSDTNH